MTAQQRWSAKQRALGLCVSCHRPAGGRFVTCLRCRVRKSARDKAKRQQARQAA